LLTPLSSISAIEKILPSSGSNPVVVFCDDLNYYASKYGKPHDLFNEHIGASFARIWEIPVPNSALIYVNLDHIPAPLPQKPFSIPCFGSFYLEYAKDVNDYLLTWKNNPYELNKIINPADLLKIGLFDIWLSNEDRNHNNSNLLIQPLDKGYQFVAIDHVNLFNSNSLEQGMYQLNEYESIICTDFVKMLFKRGQRLTEIANVLVQNFYIYVRKCLKDLPKILKQVPAAWNIDLVSKGTLMKNQLGDKVWLEQTVQSFRLFLEQQLKRDSV
jgi:hypothetical protein